MNTQEEEYVTLFCEGDGGVYISTQGYPSVSYFQKERDVLDYILPFSTNVFDGRTVVCNDGIQLWRRRR